jgi:hypothetical protein
MLVETCSAPVMWNSKRSKHAGQPQRSQWQCMLLVCSAYSLTLKTEVVSSSEMSVNFYQTTRHHKPDDGSLQSSREPQILQGKNVKLSLCLIS